MSVGQEKSITDLEDLIFSSKPQIVAVHIKLH
jgi:hypothetical protein